MLAQLDSSSLSAAAAWVLVTLALGALGVALVRKDEKLTRTAEACEQILKFVKEFERLLNQHSNQIEELQRDRNQMMHATEGRLAEWTHWRDRSDRLFHEFRETLKGLQKAVEQGFSK